MKSTNMKSTITEEQRQHISEVVSKMHLPAGLGNAENACSIAAINIALTGKLTDAIPECMSLVIGTWIISAQDQMDDADRNSSDWKSLLPFAAGTGNDQDKEKARLELILAHMWSELAKIQHVADKHGFGTKWKAMTTNKTACAARAAAAAAYAALAADSAAAAAARAAAAAADSVAARAAAADSVADAAARAAVAAVADAAARAARAAAATADAADSVADAAAYAALAAAAAAADSVADAAARVAAAADAYAAALAADACAAADNPANLLKSLLEI